MNKKAYKRMLDELCSDYCDNDKWCILKEFLISSHPSPRLLLQMKCMEIIKWELGKKFNKEFNWQETILYWTENGYAKLFADLYNENTSPRKLYIEIIKVKPL